MKKLSEYPTPETDIYKGSWATNFPDGVSIFEHARDLEQRLAACREALSFYASPSDYLSPLTGGLGKLYFDCGQKAQETLTITAPK